LRAFRVDAAGANIVDQNIILAQLPREGFCHTDDAAADGVGENQTGDGFFDRIGSDVNDAACADLAHMRHRLTSHPHGAHKTQIESVVPIFVGKI
jgi:hypothetical protein